MKIFIADYIGLIYLQESFLKEGHTIYLNINKSFDHKNIDNTNLSDKYPGQIINVEEKSKLDNVVSIVDFGIIFDCKEEGIVEKCFKKHKKVLVHSKATSPYVLEKDRMLSKSINFGFDKYDIHLVKSYKEFKETTLTKKYVLKAYNENSKYINKNFRTIITNNNKELDDILKEDKYGHLKSGGAILEEYIAGEELCCGLYWDGSKIVANTIFINQEYKGVLDNNRSNILCGESGTVIVPVDVEELPVRFKKVISNLSEYLKTHYPDFHGFIDFNTMIKGNKIYLLEFTVRAGIPTEYEIAAIVKDYPEFIKCVATGDTFNHKIKRGIYTFVCLYPYGYPITYGRQVFFNMKTPMPKNIIPVFYKYEGKDIYYFECDRCLAFYGLGRTIEESRKRCYNSVYKWDDNNLIYRNDIGTNFEKAFNLIKRIK